MGENSSWELRCRMKTLRLSEIKVKRRFRKDMGDLQRLKDSIEDVGLIQPIVVNSKNELIAGARRLAAMRELGMKNIPVVVADIDPLSGEIHENTLRKDFTISELVAISRAVAKTRKPGTRTDLGANYAEVEKGRSSEIVEKLTGISARNLDKMESIVSAVEEKPSSWVRVVGINGSKP